MEIYNIQIPKLACRGDEYAQQTTFPMVRWDMPEVVVLGSIISRVSFLARKGRIFR